MPPKASKTPSKAAASKQQPSLGSLPFNFGSMPPAAGKVEFKMQVSWKPDAAQSAPAKPASKTTRKRKVEDDSAVVTPMSKKARNPTTTMGKVSARTPAKGKFAPAPVLKESDAMGMIGGATARSTPYHISNGRLLPDNGFTTAPSSSPFSQPQLHAPAPASTYSQYHSPSKREHSTFTYGTDSKYDNTRGPFSKHQAAQRAYEGQIAQELGVSTPYHQNDEPPSYEESIHDRGQDDGDEDCGYVFTFGMYQGMSFEDVAAQDPGYLDWCIRDNVRMGEWEFRDALARWRSGRM